MFARQVRLKNNLKKCCHANVDMPPNICTAWIISRMRNIVDSREVAVQMILLDQLNVIDSVPCKLSISLFRST